MMANVFRHFYDYHFRENRNVWDTYRAQLLGLLNDLGVKTVSQDYIFYAYDHPMLPVLQKVREK
jgi:hypothetical protein